jgi:Cys-rich repeat protein
MKLAGIIFALVLAFVFPLPVQAQPGCTSAGAMQATSGGGALATGSGWTWKQVDLSSPQGLTCTNTQPPGGVDTGCEPILNACTDGGTCVDCLNDADCSLPGDVCNTVTSSCVQCLDSGPGLVDAGCESITLNACLNGGSANAMCVDCLVGADCADGFVCDTGTNACVECTLDSDCPVGVCNTATSACVECTVDAHCANGLLCETESNVCVFSNLIFWDSFEAW